MVGKYSVYSGRGNLVLARTNREVADILHTSVYDVSRYYGKTGLSNFSGRMKAVPYMPERFGDNSWGIAAIGNSKKIIGGFRSKSDATKAIARLKKHKMVFQY